MAGSPFSPDSSLSDLNDLNNRNTPPASILDVDGDELVALGSQAGQESPQSLGSPDSRTAIDSETSSSLSTVAAPGAWHQHQLQQEWAGKRADTDHLSPSPEESEYTAAPNPLVDLVVGASSRAYRTLATGFDSPSSLSDSIRSPASQWEGESEYITEEVITPIPKTPKPITSRTREREYESERKRGKRRAIEPEEEDSTLPVSPPRGVGPVRRVVDRDEEVIERKPKSEEEKGRRRRRRVHYYYYSTGNQEYGFSRDFFLVIWLCLGIACFLILVGRSVRVSAVVSDMDLLL